MKLSVRSGGIWSSLLLTSRILQRKREWQIISHVNLQVILIGSWWSFFLKGSPEDLFGVKLKLVSITATTHFLCYSQKCKINVSGLHQKIAGKYSWVKLSFTCYFACLGNIREHLQLEGMSRVICWLFGGCSSSFPKAIKWYKELQEST